MTATITLATRPNLDREAWLADRRQRIGASEAAAALGLSPFESPRELYLRKIGELPDAEENEAMLWGNILEPVIAAEYARRTGNAVSRCQVELRAEHGGAPLGATLDGLTEAGWPVEFKTINAWSAREIGEEETDELPPHWLVQGHQQMLLAQADRVDFAILVGGQRLEIRTVTRNEALLGQMLLMLPAFWGHVQRREPPPLQHRADRQIMHLIYPGCEGEVDLGDGDAEDVERWQSLGAEIRAAETRREDFKASILERLGNAARGRLPDGRIVTRRIQVMPDQTITRKGYTYTDLRIKKGGAK